MAVARLTDASAIWERLGNVSGAAQTTFALGGIAETEGDDGRATAHCEAALVLHRQVGDRRSIALTLENLADAAYRRGARAGIDAGR